MFALRNTLLALLLVAWTAAAAPAQPNNIEEAVRKGGNFLAKNWAEKQPQNAYGVGGASLAGMAMIEAGVKPDDPGMKAVTAYIREGALAQTETYHVSLAIQFLDKLADPRDIPVIQLLGVRLYSGLTSTGTWTYSTWDKVTPQELVRLNQMFNANELVGAPNAKPVVEPKPVEPKAAPSDDPFRQPPAAVPGADPFRQPPGAAPPGVVPPPGKPIEGRLHAEVARTHLIVSQAIRNGGRQRDRGDNSNTQFGLIGLWVASRHGVPAADAFALVELHYLNSQSPQDGGWDYKEKKRHGSTISMTCAGLIGLAAGAANRERVLQAEENRRPPAPKPPAAAKDDNPFFNPMEPAEPARPAAGARPIALNPRDRAIEAGLLFVGRAINASKPKAGDQIDGSTDHSLHYMLWSVERVAVAYGLETIGDADWYRWGSNHLLATQRGDGSWHPAHYTPEVNTAFAILFLTKANSVRDLSGKLRGKVKDPGRAELRAGGAVPFTPVKPGTSTTAPNTTTPGTTSPAVPPPSNPTAVAKGPGTGTVPPTPTTPNPSPATPPGTSGTPASVPAGTDAESERIARSLAAASAEMWTARLAEVRDAKGAAYTRGLALAAARLDGTRRTEVRDALADRLTRMTSATLRTLLRDPEAEIRRAACLACGMKDDRNFVPNLADRIVDDSELVVKAARAALKSLTSVDFGPESSSDDEAKKRAAAAWRNWWTTQQGKK